MVAGRNVDACCCVSCSVVACFSSGRSFARQRARLSSGELNNGWGGGCVKTGLIFTAPGLQTQ